MNGSDSQKNMASSDTQGLSALKQNAGNIALLISILLSGYFGWQYWSKNKPVDYDFVAADKYANIQNKSISLNQDIDSNTTGESTDNSESNDLSSNLTEFNNEVNELVTNHQDSIYAWQALMLKARHESDANDFAAALATLKQASDLKLEDEGLKTITVLRQAQALYADNQLDEALALAQTEMPVSFQPSQNELIADIELAKGNKEAAIDAYQKAWQLLLEREENRAMLALKMESLGIKFTKIEQPSLINIPTQAPSLSNSESESNTES